MKTTAKEFVDNFLSDEAYETPSDTVSIEELEFQMKLPEWFDEKKYNQGRRFFWDFSFGLATAATMGLLSICAIPSILNILSGTGRSNSPYTAYKRYSSTFMHMLSWFNHELKPGSPSWKSLLAVRTRHLKAGKAARLKKKGTICQRDLSLTSFAAVGLIFVKPDKFSLRPLQEGDWEAYNHVFRVFGYMLGIQDRYNICRETFEETREICSMVMDRIFTPCLENVPEYFEHMIHVTVEGLQCLTPSIEKTSLIYFTKYIANVPGYIYTEQDRLDFQAKLKKHLKGKPEEFGVKSTELMEKYPFEALPNTKPRNTRIYFHDYDSLDKVPAYKNLPFIGKYKLGLFMWAFAFYNNILGRILLNFYYRWMLFLGQYFPYIAMWRYGINDAFVNMFKEDPLDNTIPKLNSEYYKVQITKTWYRNIIDILW